MTRLVSERGARFCFFSLLGILVVLGVWRSILPQMVFDNWSGLVLVVAVAAACVQLLRVRAYELGHEAILLAVFPLVLVALYLQPQRVASDGVFYFAPLRSMVVDGDLDFENEYRVLGAQSSYLQRTPTGRLPNSHSIGPAILWLPFYLPVHALAWLGLYRPTGFGYPYFTAIATGTAVFGFLGILFVFRLVRAYFEPGIALVVTLGTWLATFHVWYMVFEPSMSHAPAMASVAAFLLFTHRGVRGWRSFALAGALGGLVVLVRWQNVLFLPVALWTSYPEFRRHRLHEIALAVLAFLVVFVPQTIYWKLLYGSFLLVPQGRGFIDWTAPELSAVLFSSRHGLLAWAPVLWLALAGWPGLVRRTGALGWGLTLSILATWYLNASVDDWWSGASYGLRRFDGALPGFALGLAVTLSWIVPRVQKRPLLVVAVGLFPLLIWNTMLMGVYFTRTIPPDGPASFRSAARDGIDLFYPWIGYPPSWPASIRDWVSSSRPLGAYDLAGALAPSNNVRIRMGDTDALYLGRGWSLPRRNREQTWRDASPHGAEVFVALRESASYVLAIVGRESGQGTVFLDGERLAELDLGGSGQIALEIPSERIHRGVHSFVFFSKGRGLSLYRIDLIRPDPEDRPELAP